MLIFKRNHAPKINEDWNERKSHLQRDIQLVILSIFVAIAIDSTLEVIKYTLEFYLSGVALSLSLILVYFSAASISLYVFIPWILRKLSISYNTYRYAIECKVSGKNLNKKLSKIESIILGVKELTKNLENTKFKCEAKVNERIISTDDMLQSDFENSVLDGLSHLSYLQIASAQNDFSVRIDVQKITDEVNVYFTFKTNSVGSMLANSFYIHFNKTKKLFSRFEPNFNCSCS